jgi:hypothetical protein
MSGKIHDQRRARDDRHSSTQGGQGGDLGAYATRVFHETGDDSLREPQSRLGSLVPRSESAASRGEYELRVLARADFLELGRDLILPVAYEL